MSIDQRLVKITKKLCELTDIGKISWEETASKNVFQTPFSNYTLHIALRSNKDAADLEDIVITIFNDEGISIESFTDEDIGHLDDFFNGENTYRSMNRLYDRARRISLGSEQALNEILSELDDLVPPF